jgi:hypothetical protein
MKNVLWLTLMCMLLLTGCGWNGTPTRANDFTPLTSIEISAVTSTIAAGTSTTLKATGNFSGQFTRDITNQVSWSSGSTVASFPFPAYPNRVKAGAAAGTAALTASMGGITSTSYTLTVSSATITGLVISPATPVKAKGLTTQFSALGTFSDTTNQDLTFDVTWSSSDITKVTVSDTVGSKGLALAVAEGSATITAAFGASSDSTVMTVTPPTLQSIAVTPANSTLSGLSKTQQFTAIGTYSDGTTADVTTQVAWVSSLPAIATINASSGLATSVAAGTTVISATLSGASGNTNFTVTTPTLIANGLKITSGNLTQAVGTTNQLVVTATFSDSSTLVVTSSCEWSSSNPSIATVGNTASDKGLVTAGLVGGFVAIHATYGGQTLSTSITIQ